MICHRCRVKWKAVWPALFPAHLCPMPKPGGRCGEELEL